MHLQAAQHVFVSVTSKSGFDEPGLNTLTLLDAPKIVVPTLGVTPKEPVPYVVHRVHRLPLQFENALVPARVNDVCNACVVVVSAWVMQGNACCQRKPRKCQVQHSNIRS